MTDMRIHNKGRVNKAKSVRFTLNGKTYSGFEGDTLASAMLANGEHLAGAAAWPVTMRLPGAMRVVRRSAALISSRIARSRPSAVMHRAA